jgi:aspartate aminotransferase-like enzyme
MVKKPIKFIICVKLDIFKGGFMKKKYLFAPGPTPIPEDILLSMAKPIIHHRSPAFSEILEEVREGLKYLFQTQNEVLIFSSSGTGAMEGAVSNFFCKGDKVLVIRGGKFGERWSEICEAYNLRVKNINVEWGKAVDPELIRRLLKEDNDIKGVLLQASETSTGVMHPVEDIANIVREYKNTIIVVDAITGIGVFDIPTDKWGLDVVVGGSQKALMLPPGLAFASVSEKAWRFAESSDLPKYYFDFKKELKSLLKNSTSYTPAVSLVIGLRDSLGKIKRTGLKNVFDRHEKLANATRAAMKALGLELYAQDSPSNAVTAVCVPDKIDGSQIVKTLREKYGITIAGGQDRAKGKIFRIAHLGYFDKFDILMAISAIEMVLKDLGYNVELGKGVKAAMEVLY